MEKVAIVGLGYVGLPLACLCAEKGLGVKGYDVDSAKAALINEGKSPIRDTALEKKLGALEGKISATADAKVLAETDVVAVCVPTPAKNGKPDLSFVEEACETISKYLKKGQLVIIESTVYPGTTEEIIQPILEKSGLKAGKDFLLAYCPERIDPGNEKWTIENIPRVISALSEEGKRRALEFYKKLVGAEIVALGSVKEAEAVKIMENTFRDVNIAFVNELAMSFDKMGIDVSEVIKGASTKPFGFMPFHPGPGVGGHCIAQDPYYLIERAGRAGFSHEFLKLARKINNAMPHYVAELVQQALEKNGKDLGNAKIAVLGLAYKADVDDTRESPALKIIELLKAKNPSIKIYDPFLPKQSNAGIDEALKDADCVVVTVNHKHFLDALSADNFKSAGVKAVIDCRNCLDKGKISAAGILYKGIGR